VESHKANGALHYARAKELQAAATPSAAPAQEDDISAVMSTEEQSAQVSRRFCCWFMRVAWVWKCQPR